MARSRSIKLADTKNKLLAVIKTRSRSIKLADNRNKLLLIYLIQRYKFVKCQRKCLTERSEGI